MVLVEGAGMGRRPDARVRRLQRMLVRHGFGVGRSGIDGRFGPVTAAAVRRLQARYGLAADGVVGSKTGRLLALLQARSRAQKPARSRPRAGVRLLRPAPLERPAVRPDRTPAPPATATWALVALAAALLLAVVLAARVVRASAAATGRGKTDAHAMSSGAALVRRLADAEHGEQRRPAPTARDGVKALARRRPRRRGRSSAT